MAKGPIEDIIEPDAETCDSWEECCGEDTDVAARGEVCITCEFYIDCLCVLWGEE